MNAKPSSLPLGLAAQLRTATHEEHRKAETRPLARDLLKGVLPLPAYCLLLRNLQPVYEALESALAGDEPDHRTPRTLTNELRDFAGPELRRASALADDLTFLHGPRWDRDLPLLPAGCRYRDRVRNLGGSDPLCLVSHAYVRYLGDLSGGQAIGRVVRERYTGGDQAGASFYQFADIADRRAYKDKYRRRLDRLGERVGRPADLLDEARRAFRMNRELFDEVYEQIDVSP
jgi:heme oxygenase